MFALFSMKHVLVYTLVHCYTRRMDNECMEMHMNEITSRLNETETGAAERVHQQDYAVDASILASDFADDECDCVHPSAVMAARRALGDAPPAERMAELFAILGDPTRMRVLTALASGELCVSDLAVATGVNRTTVSHQLRVLRSHRMVRRRRDGKAVYYTLDDDHVSSLLEMAAAHAHEDHGDLVDSADRRMA